MTTSVVQPALSRKAEELIVYDLSFLAASSCSTAPSSVETSCPKILPRSNDGPSF